ncbi:hypothetical protein HDU93_001355 [Gonapodya sp. JEL0774]|nr:hypothetical protein HDU93_001355 [Gonapodya sp. JEL0774]
MNTSTRVAVDQNECGGAADTLELAHYLDLQVLVEACSRELAEEADRIEWSVDGGVEPLCPEPPYSKLSTSLVHLPLLHLKHPVALLIAERHHRHSLTPALWSSLWRRCLARSRPPGTEHEAWGVGASEVRVRVVAKWIEDVISGERKVRVGMVREVVTAVGSVGDVLTVVLGRSEEDLCKDSLLEVAQYADGLKEVRVVCHMEMSGWEKSATESIEAVAEGTRRREDGKSSGPVLVLELRCSQLGDAGYIAGLCAKAPTSTLLAVSPSPGQQPTSLHRYVRLVPDQTIDVTPGVQRHDLSAKLRSRIGAGMVTSIPSTVADSRDTKSSKIHIRIKATHDPRAPILSSSLRTVLASIAPVRLVGFDVERLIISTQDGEQIASMMSAAGNHLTRLRLTGCFLAIEDLVSLCEVAARSELLEDLGLEDLNYLGGLQGREDHEDQDTTARLASALVALFKRRPSPLRVLVSGVVFPGHPCLSMCRAAVTSGTREVRLRRCGIGAAGISEMASILDEAGQGRETVFPHTLDLSESGAPPRTIATLVAEITRSGWANVLKELDLSGAGFDTGAAVAIARFLERGPNALRVLRLRGTAAGPHLGDTGFREVMSGLTRCEGLETVDFRRQRVGDLGAVWLGKKLGSGVWPNIRRIGLEDNAMTDVGASEIWAAIARRYESWDGGGEVGINGVSGSIHHNEPPRWGLVIELDGNFVSPLEACRLESWRTQIHLQGAVQCIAGVVRCPRQNSIGL